MMMKTKATGLTIKMIYADGMVKGLVLDLDKVDGRLLYISSGATVEEAWQGACKFLVSYRANSVGWQ